MSYDLYFYAENKGDLPIKEIEGYLSEKLGDETNDQWFYKNEDTGVYFIFERYDPTDEGDDILEVFGNTRSTGLAFNLNLIRPDFFGLEAFQFVDQLIAKFDLYVFDFQGDLAPPPYKPGPGDLYHQWSAINIRVRDLIPGDVDLFYYPQERSSRIWSYNFERRGMQDRLGEDYFVPTALFVKTLHNNQPASVTTWTQHIPCVIPPVDYIILIRKYKRLFRWTEDQGVVYYTEIMSAFDGYFEVYEPEGCKIIHPEMASKAEKLFNSIQFEYSLEGFWEPIALENISNVATGR